MCVSDGLTFSPYSVPANGTTMGFHRTETIFIFLATSLALKAQPFTLDSRDKIRISRYGSNSGGKHMAAFVSRTVHTRSPSRSCPKTSQTAELAKYFWRDTISTCSVDDVPPSLLSARLLGSYQSLCARRPLLTKAISAAVIGGVGDLLAQILERVSLFTFTIQWYRLAVFVMTEFLFDGPFLHFWYEFIYKIGQWFETKFGLSPRSRLKTLFQISVDQTLGVAIYYPAYFYAYEIVESLLAGQGMSKVTG